MRRALLVLSVAVGLSGCTLLVRGSEFLTDGAVGVDAGPGVDGGGRDAATPDGGGPDDDGGGDDGGGPDDDGGGLDAAVANRTPLASGIGLDHYAPFLGSTVRAIAGPVYDADGDSLSLRYVWRRNGTVVPGANSATIIVDAARFAVGDQVVVELEASDPETASMVVRSPAAEIANDGALQWRPIVPPRATSRNSLRAFDADAQRLLFWSRHGNLPGEDFGLWEMQLSPTGTGPWVRLAPTGVAPVATDGVMIHDRARHRVIVIGGRIDTGGGGGDTLSDGIFTLDYGTRGEEVWTEVFPSPRPPARTVTSFTVSADGARAWIYGGLVEPDLLDDVWEIDLEDLSFRSVTAATGDPTVGAALIHDPARNRLVRAGGGTIPAGMMMPVPANTIGVVDLGTGTYTAMGALPTGLLGAQAVVEGTTAYVALGGASTLGRNTEVFTIDLATLAVGMISAPEAPLVLLPIVVPRAPFADTYVVSGTSFDGGSADFYDADFAAGTFTPITAAGVTLPPPLMQATARLEETGGMTVVGGRGGRAVGTLVESDSWRLAPNGDWTRRTPGPDPGIGAPEPRWGIVYDASQPHPWREAWHVLGRTATGSGDGTPWRLSGSGDNWQRLGMASAITPSARVGAVSFAGNCQGGTFGMDRANVIGLFGGENETGMPSSDTWMLNCVNTSGGGGAAPTMCNWLDDTTDPIRARPPGRSFGAAALAGHDSGSRERTAFMFGGRGSLGVVYNDTYAIDSCMFSTAQDYWHPVSLPPMGDVPSPRFGHSMTHQRPNASAPVTAGSRILLFSGGTQDNGYSTFQDVWRFVPTGRSAEYEGRWEELTPETSDGSPAGRMFHVAVYDPVRQRLLVYGGFAADRTMDDLWELRLASTP